MLLDFLNVGKDVLISGFLEKLQKYIGHRRTEFVEGEYYKRAWRRNKAFIAQILLRGDIVNTAKTLVNTRVV